MVDVVGARQNVHSAGVVSHHILVKTSRHLMGILARYGCADRARDQRRHQPIPGSVVSVEPVVGDAVANEDSRPNGGRLSWWGGRRGLLGTTAGDKDEGHN